VSGYLAPFLVDGDPVSAEALFEFFQAVAGQDAPSRIKVATAAASAPLTVTTAVQSVTGATVNVTVTGQNAFGLVLAVFDLTNTLATASFRGLVYIDGAEQDTPAVKWGDGAADRATYSQFFPVNLPAGAHTINLRAVKDLNTGTFTVNATNTTLTLLVVDLP
jgi:hypothetical protein